MLIFSDAIRGAVHHEYVPEGQAVNKEYYVNVLRHSRERTCRVRSELWTDNSWIFYDDNAPSYRATIVNAFTAKHSINTIDQALYTPDLARRGFSYFQK